MALDESIVNSLPEDIRNEPSFAEIQKGDLPGVFKNLIDSQKTLGRAIILPDEKETPEKRAEKLNSVYDKLGRPKDPKEYKFDEAIPKDMGIDPERLDHWTKIMHEAGLTNAQASRLVKEHFAEISQTGLTKDFALKQLSEVWGESTEANLGVARLSLSKFDESGELLEFLETTGLGNHPTILKFLHNVGLTLKEDSSPRLQGRAQGGDRAGAESKLASIMNDKNHPYWDKSKAGHKEAIEEVATLHKTIHGSQVVATLGTH